MMMIQGKFSFLCKNVVLVPPAPLDGSAEPLFFTYSLKNSSSQPNSRSNKFQYRVHEKPV